MCMCLFATGAWRGAADGGGDGHGGDGGGDDDAMAVALLTWFLA